MRFTDEKRLFVHVCNYSAKITKNSHNRRKSAEIYIFIRLNFIISKLTSGKWRNFRKSYVKALTIKC